MVQIWATNDEDSSEEWERIFESECWAIMNLPFYPDYITTQRSGNPHYRWGDLLSFIDRRIDLDNYKDDLREIRRKKNEKKQD